MLSRHDHAYELTWHKPSRRWKKQIRGQVIYFGKAKSRDDLPGYARALSNYRHWQKTGRRIEDPQPPSPLPADTPSADADAISSTTPPRPLTALLDEYLACQWQRYRRGVFIETQQQQRSEHRNTPVLRPAGGDTIVYDTYQQIRHLSVHLREACRQTPFDGSEQAGAELLVRFREICERKLFSGAWKPATFNGAIKTGRSFIGWLYRNYYLQSLPRQLSELCRKYRTLPSARAIPPETLRRFWRGAPQIDTRLRTFMCLGLNCGYYGKDIATLRREHLQSGCIIRERRKTGVPTRHKLWGLTKELIAETASDNGGLLFPSRRGGSLVHPTPRCRGRCDNIGNFWWKLRRKTGVREYTFGNLRDTSATRVEEYQPLIKMPEMKQ